MTHDLSELLQRESHPLVNSKTFTTEWKGQSVRNHSLQNVPRTICMAQKDRGENRTHHTLTPLGFCLNACSV